MAKAPNPRTQSRYQRGLSYEPGMAESRYRPERATGGGGAPVTGVGGGVSPIIPPDDDEGVVVPVGGGGGGMGGGALAGAGLLAALANPNLLTSAARLLGVGGAGAGAVSGVTQGSTSLAGAAAPAAGAPVAPVGALAPEAATQGATSGGGGAGAPPPATSGIPTIMPDSGIQLPWGVPFNIGPRPTDLLPLVDGPVAAIDGGAPIGAVDWATGQPWDFGAGGGVMDGGLGAEALGADLVGQGAGAATGGFEGAMGSGLLGSGFSPLGLGLTLGGGLLGNYVAGQAGYEGDRDPMGQQIGSGLGSAVGGLFLGPIGAFLGAQLGGAIGGQFGPQQSVGANWNAGFTWSPEMANVVNNSQVAPGSIADLGQFGWSYGGGADNGGTMNNDFANAFQQQLLAMAQAQGYQINPLAVGAGYAVGQFLGNSETAPGQGYFYKAANDYSDNPSQFFGTDLNAAYRPFNGAFGGMFPASNLTAGQQMLNYAFNDLVNQGLFTQGPVVSQDAALQQLLGTAQTNAQGYQTNFNNVQQQASVG